MHKSNVVSAVAMVILLLVGANEGQVFPTHTTTVSIANHLASRATLLVHCKAKGADLGTHRIPINAPYAFGLKAAVSGGASYQCWFHWTNQLKWFDIYEERRDFNTCGLLCTWVVKESGPCLVAGHGSDSPASGSSKWQGTKCYPWNK